MPAPKLNLAITKIDEENDDDQVQIIKLTSPMRVRSPLDYKSSFNLDDNPSKLSVSSKSLTVDLPAANIKTISNPILHLEPPQESFRKTSFLSLKSLSMSLKSLKNRTRSDSLDAVDHVPTLETIDETSRKSIFKMDLFEKNLKKFVSKPNEADFQTYSEYSQNQKDTKNKPKTYFKNQKVYARRSSTSDINDPSKIPHPKLLQQQEGMSTSSSNVKQEEAKKKEKHKKQVEKTAEMLKEVRTLNMETSKRTSKPRRISTAY